jgi:hypothetical protein
LPSWGEEFDAAGDSTTAGANPASRIAKWNGSEWSPLGGGLNAEALALAVQGGDILVGGAFTEADGQAASRIARWDGQNWTRLGLGLNSTVRALAVSDGSVYAGGDFVEAGGLPAARLAKWNGVRWSSLGSGLDGSVWSLAVVGSELFVGGHFSIAGSQVSAYLAKANIIELKFGLNSEGLMFSWPSTGSDGFDLQRSANVAEPASWTPSGAVVSDNGMIKSATIPFGNGPEFFRLRKEP